MASESKLLSCIVGVEWLTIMDVLNFNSIIRMIVYEKQFWAGLSWSVSYITLSKLYDIVIKVIYFTIRITVVDLIFAKNIKFIILLVFYYFNNNKYNS